MDEPPGYREQQIAARLRVVEALLWGVENAEVVLDISRSSRTRDEAVAGLGTHHGIEEFCAHHILDMTFGRLTETAVASLNDEAARLRRGDFTEHVGPSRVTQRAEAREPE